jgi:hypothetical protein
MISCLPSCYCIKRTRDLRYLTSNDISFFSHLAVKYWANAVETTSSGAKMPNKIHLVRLKLRCLSVESSVGTFRCNALQTHIVNVSTHETMTSQVPRKLGAEYQAVVSVFSEETCRTRMQSVRRENIIK